MQLCKFCIHNPDEAISTYGGLPICLACQIEVEETLYQDAMAEEAYIKSYYGCPEYNGIGQPCGSVLCPEHGDSRDTNIDAVREGRF